MPIIHRGRHAAVGAASGWWRVTSLNQREVVPTRRSHWHGDDPAAFSAVLAALQDADIQTHEISAHYHLSRIPGTYGPLQGIYVHSEDLPAAHKVIAEVLARNEGTTA